MHNAATQWERRGLVDPYYGVCSTGEFRGENLDDALERSFASGRAGVGRLVVDLPRGAHRVVGVDASPGSSGPAVSASCTSGRPGRSRSRSTSRTSPAAAPGRPRTCR